MGGDFPKLTDRYIVLDKSVCNSLECILVVSGVGFRVAGLGKRVDVRENLLGIA